MKKIYICILFLLASMSFAQEDKRLYIEDIKNFSFDKIDKGKISLVTIRDSTIDSIPEIIKDFTFLKDISLNCKNLRVIPNYFEQFKYLNSIELYNMAEINLDSAFYVLSKVISLKELKLYNLGKASLPSNIGLLKQLEELEISNCKFDSLPREFGSLKLKRLFLRENTFRDYHIVDKYISRIHSLESLNYQDDNIRILSSPITDMRNLKHLVIDSKKLYKVDSSIGELSNLEVLMLDGNKLKELPQSMEKLKELKVLVLCGQYLVKRDISKIIPWCRIFGL